MRLLRRFRLALRPRGDDIAGQVDHGDHARLVRALGERREWR